MKYNVDDKILLVHVRIHKPSPNMKPFILFIDMFDVIEVKEVSRVPPVSDKITVSNEKYGTYKGIINRTYNPVSLDRKQFEPVDRSNDKPYFIRVKDYMCQIHDVLTNELLKSSLGKDVVKLYQEIWDEMVVELSHLGYLPAIIFEGSQNEQVTILNREKILGFKIKPEEKITS